MLLEPICYDLLDVSLARNLFPDDLSSELKGGGVQFDLAKTNHSLWLGVRDKPFFAAVDLLKVKDQVFESAKMALHLKVTIQRKRYLSFVL